MKAILLAGGKGTRLRPLTIHTPKPIVPIFDRAFLHYQIDLLKQVPEIDEVILSLNYQPRRIEEIFGDGAGTGVRIRYVVEPAPLGTGGAIRFAAQGVTDTLVVFNGDVMTSVDVNHVVALHRERGAKATIVLTPVENPSAYGLVETRPDGAVRRFLEKPERRTRSPATRSTPASTCSSRTPSIAFPRTWPTRSSAATFRRSSSAASRSSPTSIAAIGSTSAHRRSTSRCTATCSTGSFSGGLVRVPPIAPGRSSRPTLGSRTARGSRRRASSTAGAHIKPGAVDRSVLGHRPRRRRRGRGRGRRQHHLAEHPHRPACGRRGRDSGAQLPRRPLRARIRGHAVLGDKTVLTRLHEDLT